MVRRAGVGVAGGLGEVGLAAVQHLLHAGVELRVRRPAGGVGRRLGGHVGGAVGELVDRAVEPAQLAGRLAKGLATSGDEPVVEEQVLHGRHQVLAGQAVDLDVALVDLEHGLVAGLARASS
jgi:hypothetical protein